MKSQTFQSMQGQKTINYKYALSIC